MAYFKVMLHGDGLSVPADATTPGFIGFYTTRLVRANTDAEARAKALQLVESEWSPGGSYSVHRTASLSVRVESVDECSFLDSLSFANRGYTFYSTNDALDA